MEGWQIKWGGSGEEADRVGPLGTGSQCIAFFMLKHVASSYRCWVAYYIYVYVYISVKLRTLKGYLLSDRELHM